MNEQLTVEQLMAKAGVEIPPKPDPTAPKEKRLRGMALAVDRKAREYARLYVKHHFNPQAAYEEFSKRYYLRDPHKKRAAGMYWLTHPRVKGLVSKYVSELVKEASKRTVQAMETDLDLMREINRATMFIDPSQFLEEIIEHDKDGVAHVVTRYKPISKLSLEQKFAIQEITVSEQGIVTKIKTHDRIRTQMAQLAILEHLKHGGPNTALSNADIRKRLDNARQRAIDAALRTGKLVMLGNQQKPPIEAKAL